jgi:type II secretory pathway component GspD/PulD (secretin)
MIKISNIKYQKSKIHIKNKKFFTFLVCVFYFWFLIFCFPGYTQEISSTQQKISLDIKGMDILDVLKMLSSRAGMNIVVSRNVTGRVTMFLKDVDIFDAFEIILLANDLAYEKKAGIINVMTSRDYELLYGKKFSDKKEVLILPLKYAKAVELSRTLTQLKSDIGRVVVDEGSNTIILIDLPEKLKMMEGIIKGLDLPTETQVFELNYATADKIMPKIQELLTKGVGTIRIDERTNKIVITDFPEKIREIESVIKTFDEKTPQVLIDAQIIEITPSDEFKMGVDWDYWIRKNLRATLPLQADMSHKLTVGVTNVTEPGQYKAILGLLRTIGDTKVLSSPRITALNNQEAKILVGTKEPYIQESTQVTTEGETVVTGAVTFIDVGIKLYVTPTINKEGFITMKIRPEISEAKDKSLKSGGKEYVVPLVTTSEAETSVTVKDGITILIGGLTKDKRTKTVDKIPILGDIPILGFFFRKTEDKLEKTELVILLTPHILTGEKPITDFSEIKPTEGAVAKMERGQIITEKIVPPVKEKEISPKEAIFNYYQQLYEKINRYAKLNLPEDKKGQVGLSFTLSSKGDLIGEPKVINTTDESLIPFAIKAVKQACPFNSFPEILEKREESFYIILEYK